MTQQTKLFILTLALTVAGGLCTSAAAFVVDLSSAAYLPNNNFSTRAGVGLALSQALLDTPFNLELKGTYLSPGTASDLGADIQVFPVEVNLFWNPIASLPVLIGGGLNQSFWNASTLSSVTFAPGLGYQMFAETNLCRSDWGDIGLRAGYQNTAAQMSSSGGSSAANLDTWFVASQWALDAHSSPAAETKTASMQTVAYPAPIAIAIAEVIATASATAAAVPVSGTVNANVGPSTQNIQVPDLVIGQIPDQYARGATISLRAKSGRYTLKTVWVEALGKPLANLTSKKTYFIKEMKLPKTLKGKIKLDFFARTTDGKILSQSKTIEISNH